MAILDLGILVGIFASLLVCSVLDGLLVHVVLYSFNLVITVVISYKKNRCFLCKACIYTPLFSVELVACLLAFLLLLLLFTLQ